MTRPLALLAFLAAGCATAPPTLPPPLANIAKGDLRRELEAPSLRGLAATLDIVPPTAPLIRLLHGRTSCQPASGVNPCVYLQRANMPRAGRPFAITFSTRCGGNAPAAECWLLLSFRPMAAPISFAPYGMPGCMVLVNPDSIVYVPQEPGGLVRRVGGDVHFAWTPPATSAGTHFFLQMVVASPGQNRAGFLLSPGVEVTVGSS